MSHRNGLLSPLFIGALLLLPALLHAQSYTLAGSRAAIYNLAGVATVEPVRGPSVTVAVTTGGGDAGALTVETGDIGGKATLRVRYPSSSIVYRGNEHDERWTTKFRVNADGTFDENYGSHRGRDRGSEHGTDREWRHADRSGGDEITIVSRGRGLEAHADLRIGVPAGQTIEVHLGAGRITASNLDGTIVLSGHAASIHARGLHGAVKLDTGSGDVDAADVTGNLDVDTGSGSVTVNGTRDGTVSLDTGSGDVRATNLQTSNLDVDTGSGGIQLDDVNAARISLDTGSGEIRLQSSSEVRELSVETGSGNVTITSARGVHGSLSLETGSGNFDLAVPVQVTRREDDELHGTIGDGHGHIAIETGSGDITIRGSR